MKRVGTMKSKQMCIDKKFVYLFRQCEMHSKELIHNKIQWFISTFTIKELRVIKSQFENEKKYEIFMYYGLHGIVYILFLPLHLTRIMLQYPNSLTNIQNISMYIHFIDIIFNYLHENKDEIEMEQHPICI